MLGTGPPPECQVPVPALPPPHQHSTKYRDKCKDKTIPKENWTCPKGSRSVTFLDFKTTCM